MPEQVKREDEVDGDSERARQRVGEEVMRKQILAGQQLTLASSVQAMGFVGVISVSDILCVVVPKKNEKV